MFSSSSPLPPQECCGSTVERLSYTFAVLAHRGLGAMGRVSFTKITFMTFPCFVYLESDYMYHRYTSPLGDLWAGKDVARVWPNAMEVGLMQNCCPKWNASTVESFGSIVCNGGALMFDGWWWNSDKNPVVQEAYEWAHNHSFKPPCSFGQRP
eukprot:m.779618 g.779618  ORF g.779618 m.779618 type:complete len:153 (-) comp23279_c0_seq4:2850-3308(-)